MRSVLAMLLVSATALAAPPGLTPPVVRGPTAAPPPAPPPGPQLTAIDRASLPDKCVDLASRADSPEPALAQTSRLSLALCIAHERTRPIALCDCKQSIDELDEAIAPAIEILDEVASRGEPLYRILALEAKADQYQVLVNKLVATLPPPRSDANVDERELYDIRQTSLQSLLQPWLSLSHGAYVAIDHLATLHPELAKNREVQSAVRDSRKHLATAVAQP